MNKSAIIIKPATIIKFHKALIKQKYHLLFSPKSTKKSGPKGTSKELIQSIMEMKKRNSQYGYLRIAMQIKNIFGVNINKDIVRRILQKNFKNYPGDNNGPSWLSFIANVKNSLWSIDFFRCESIKNDSTILSKYSVKKKKRKLLEKIEARLLLEQKEAKPYGNYRRSC